MARHYKMSVCQPVEDLNFASLLFGLVCACEIGERRGKKSKEMKFPGAYRHVVGNKIARQ